eukprot:1263557-Pyramimonas_sp.AAC.1
MHNQRSCSLTPSKSEGPTSSPEGLGRPASAKQEIPGARKNRGRQQKDAATMRGIRQKRLAQNSASQRLHAQVSWCIRVNTCAAPKRAHFKIQE